MSEDRRMTGWEGLLGLRGAAGETTTRQTSQVGVETKIKIQVLAFLVLVILGVPGTLAGAWLTLTGFLALIDVKLSGTDIFFVLVLLAILALGVRSALPKFESASDRVRVLVWILLIVLACVFAVVVYARLERGLKFWPTLGLVIGLGLLYGAPLLTFNMTVLLRDPESWGSPFEQRYLDLYERERFPEKEQEGVVTHEIRTEKGEFVTSTETLGLTWEQLGVFARRLIESNWDFREETWGQKDPFASYGAFRRLRNRLETQGLIRKINPDDPKSTYEPTMGGRSAFKLMAEQ